MWLDVKELSVELKIKETTIYYLIAKGAIPHYRIGKLVRFKRTEITEWMASKKAKTLKKQLERIMRSVYTPIEGRPDRLQKEVYDAL